jgi:hypothetical protein
VAEIVFDAPLPSGCLHTVSVLVDQAVDWQIV